MESRILLSGVPVVLPAASTAASYTGAAQTVAVVPGLTVSSATTVQSASVAINGGYRQGQDELGIAGQTGTSGTLSDGLAWQFNSQTGTLVLSGSASAATYQNDLAEVVYDNANVDSGAAATNGTRSVAVEVSNASGASAPAAGSVGVAVAAPTVAGTSSGTVTFDGTSSAVNVGSGIAVSSAASLSSASVAISSGYEAGEDVLTIAGQTGVSGTLADGLNWQFNSTTGTLSLSGTGSASAYQADLQQVTFEDSLYLANAPPTNGTRQLTVTATNAGGSASAAAGALDVDVSYLQYSNSQGTTLYATNPAVSEGVVIGGNAADASASDVVIDPAQLASLGTSGTVNIGVAPLANSLIIGDGSSTTVNLPGATTVLTGDKVYFDSPTTFGNLVIDGSGHTTTVGPTSLSGTSELINDSIVIDGTPTVQATGGSVVFQNSGTVDAGTTPASLTLIASQAVDVAGAVGASSELQNLTITTGTSVTMGSSVAITGNLNVTAGTSVTFTGLVTVGGNINISAGAGSSINFEGGLVVTGGLTITQGGSVTFTGGNVAVGGAVAIGSSGSYTNITSVNFAPTARLDFGGAGTIYAGSGGLTFGAAVGLNPLYTPLSLSLGTTGAIQFSSGAQVLLGSAPLTVSGATNVGFANGFTAGGVALENITGSLSVSASATTSSMDVTADATSTFAGLNVGPGGAVITSNQITFSGGEDSVTTTGTPAPLTLKPYTVSEAILVGSPGGSSAGKLNISDSDLAAINTGFTLVTIGNASTGSGGVTVGGISEALGPIQSATEIVGGSVTVTSTINIESTAAYLKLVALSTSGAVTVNAGTGINTTSGDQNPWVWIQSAGNIVIDAPVIATDTITLVAGYGTGGTGSVTVGDTGGNTGTLTTLNSTSGLPFGEPDNRIEIVAGATSGSITITGTGNTADISAAGAGSQVVLSAVASGGSITQTGLLSATNLAVTSYGSVTLNTNVTTVAQESIDGVVLTGGTAATGTASLTTGGVSGISVITSGNGYSVAPTVSLVGGGGYGAVATSVISGTVTGVTVTNAGSGYTAAPTVVFTGGGGTGAVASANLSGGVSWIEVDAGGTGYTSAPTVGFTGGGGGTGATGSATVINGVVVGVTVLAAGSGYTVAPGVTFTGAGTGAAATAVLNEIVSSITVTTPGSGYTSAPTISFTGGGGGSGAGATAIMTSGVTGFAVSSAGTGYTYLPTVVIGAGNGGATIKGIQMVGNGSVAITQAVAIAVNNVSTAPVSGVTPGTFTLTTFATSGGGIALGTMDTISGQVTLTADGAITNAVSTSTINVTTTGELIATAKTGIGTAVLPLETALGSVQATNSVSGNIFITDTDGLNVTGTGIQTAAGNGIVVVEVANGSLTVNAAVSANGSGNVLLEAEGVTAAHSDVLVTTNVSTGSGDISIIGYRGIALAGAESVTVPATGTADLWAEHGAITQDAAYAVVTNGTNIAFLAGTNVLLGLVDARSATDRLSGLTTSQTTAWGSVSVVATAGTITDAQARTVTTTEIYANNLGLQSGTGIGVLGLNVDNPVETEVATIAAATTGSGVIDIQEATGLTVGSVGSIAVNRVGAAGTTAATTTSALAGLSIAGNGSIVLRTVNGSVTLAQNVTADSSGTGDILIDAAGTGSSLALNNGVDVYSVNSGNVTLIANLNLTLAANAQVVGEGSMDLEATNGSITLTGNNEISTGNAGNLRMVAGINVSLPTTYVDAQSIAITAGPTGSITGTVPNPNTPLFLTSGALWLYAGVAIGSLATPLQAQTGALTAAAGSGGIYVTVSQPPVLPVPTEQDVTVTSVTFTLSVVNGDDTYTTVTVASQQDLTTTSNGNIQLTTVDGNITLNDGTPTNGTSVSANGTGTVTISAGGTASNLTINAAVLSGTGAIALTAGNSVNQNAAITTGGAGTVGVTATAGSIAMATSTTTTSATGGITYLAAVNETIYNLTSTTGPIGVTATTGNVTLNGSISSTSGSVSVTAGTTVNQNGNISTGSTATVGVTATAGSINMANGTSTTSGSGAITYGAGINVALALLTSTSGPINVTATTGDISDVTAANNLSTTGLATLSAATGIGATGAGQINTTVGSLTASNATSGLIVISQSGALTIVTAGVVNSGSNGGIIITVAGGTLTDSGVVTAAGSGLVLLSVSGTGYNITTSAAVSSTSGSISILASNSVTLGGAVTTGGAGTLDLEAAAGSVTIDNNETVSTGNGNVLIKGYVSVAVTGVNAGTGLATITAATGSITDGGDTLVDVTAASVRLSAAIGIGTSLLPIELATATVAAAATSGGIYLKDNEGVTVGTVAAVSVNQVLATDTTTPVGDGAATSDLTTTGGGAISLTTTAGAITLTDGIIVNALAISSDTGSVTVNAFTNVLEQSGITTGGAGTISVTATNGTITMSPGIVTTGATGAITYTAAVNILLTVITATSAPITLTATAGTITNNLVPATTVNLTTTGLATLTAGTGIGVASPGNLNTTVGSLTASTTSTSAGTGIFIVQTSAMAIASPGVQTDGGNGPISIVVTDGTFTVNGPVSAHGSDNILLDAVGSVTPASDLLVNATVTAATGDISLLGYRSVTFGAGSNVIVTGTTGTIEVVAQNGAITQTATDTAQTDGSNIIFSAATNIILGIVDAELNSDRGVTLPLSQSGWGSVSLTATTGYIQNAQTRVGTAINIFASNLRLESSTGLGILGGATTNNPILTEVITVAAVTDSAASGDINLLEKTTAVTIGAVAPFTVSQVQESGALSVISTAPLSGLTTTSGSTGAIVLEAAAGTVTVADAVTAGGAGNVLIEAQGTGSSVLAQALLESPSGDISIIGATNVTFTAGGDVEASAGGTIQVLAQAGAISQTAANYVQTDGQNITFNAATGITVGIVDARVTSDQGGTLTSQASWGDVSLKTTSGQILNAETRVASGTNIYADYLRLESATGIGALGGPTANNPIVTEVITVAAVTDSAASGDINLLEDTAITVGTVPIFSITQENANGSTTTVSTAALSGITTTALSTGGIVLETTNGTITVGQGVTAGGSGNVLIDSQAIGSSILSQALIQSASGDISILGADNVTFTAGGNVLVSGAGGTVQVAAQDGALSQLASNYIQTDGANIILTAATGITLGLVDARVNSDRLPTPGITNQATEWGNVSLLTTSGQILNAQTHPATSTNIYADNLRLESATGIGVLGGSSTNIPIITEVATVAAVTDSSVSGDINLLEKTGIAVGTVAPFSVTQANADGSTTTVTTTALAGLTTTTGSSGNIVLETIAGTISVATAVTAGAGGNILIQAQGTGFSVLDSAPVLSPTGDISIIGADNVTFSANGNVTVVNAAGTIEVLAQAGAIAQAATDTAQTDGANIIFNAATGILVGIVDARVNSDRGGTLASQSSWGNVSLLTTTGTILNAQTRVASSANIYADNLRLESSTGIGVLGGSSTNNPIVTEVATVAAVTDSATSGDINLLEDTAVTVGTVAIFTVTQANADGSTTTVSTTSLSGLTTTALSTGGIVLVTTNGTITISNAVSAGGSGNVLINAQGATSNVASQALVQSVTGNITIIGGDNVTFTAGGNVDSTGKATPAVPPVGGTVAAGAGPFFAVVDSTSDMVYVSNYFDGTVTVINGATGLVVTTLTVGANPYDIAIDETTNKIYVADQTGLAVTVIDGSTNTVAATVSLNASPTWIAVDAATDKVYASNGTNLAVIDPTNGNAVSYIAIPNGVDNLAIDARADRIYVEGSGIVTAIDGSTGTVAGTLSLPGGSSNNIAVDSSTGVVYVTEATMDQVAVIAGATDTLTATVAVPTGSVPSWLAIDPLTDKIYVAGNNLNYLSVINGADNSVVNLSMGPRNVGQETAQSVAINLGTDTIYVTNFYGSFLDVVNGATNAVTTLNVTGNNPDVLGIDQVTGAVYIPNTGDNTVTILTSTGQPASATPGGTIEVVAQAGSINQTAANYVQAAGANVIFTAADNIVLGIVDARVVSDQGGTITSQSSWGDVALTATTGTITNAQGRVASATNIFAAGLRLESTSGIGVLGSGANNPIVTEVITVAAVTDSAVSGDINLLEDTAITVGTVAVFTVTQANADGSTTTISTTSLSGLVTTALSAGAIVLATTDGTITTTQQVSAGGTGNVLLEAQGTGSSVLGQALITSASGDISIIGANNVALSSGGNVLVAGAAGTIEVLAQAGAISQGAANYAQTDGANIIFNAATGITVGIVDARVNSDRSPTPGLTNQTTEWGNVSLQTTGGAILNAQTRVATATNIYADGLRLESATGIGVLGGATTNNPIVTEVATVAAVTASAVSGDINLLEDTAITVGTVGVFSVTQVAADDSTSTVSTTSLSGIVTTTGSTGSIVLVTTDGTITVANAVTAGASGNILIQAQGTGSNIVSQALIESIAGNISIIAANGVAFAPGGNVESPGGTITTQSPPSVTTPITGVGDQIGIAINPVTNLLYVADVSGSAVNTVTVINATTDAVVAIINVGYWATGVAVNSVTNKIYVTNQGGDTVSVIDGATNTVTDTITLGSYGFSYNEPLGIAVDTTRNLVYVTENGAGGLAVINGANDSVITTIAVGSSPFGVAVDATTNTIYVANNGDSTVSVVAGTSNGVGESVTATVALGTSPVEIAVDSATDTIYTADVNSNSVSVISGATNTVTATVAAGTSTYAITADPTTNTVYAANVNGNTVTVINGATNTVSATVTVGNSPYGITVDSTRGLVYVTDAGDSAVSIINEGFNTTALPGGTIGVVAQAGSIAQDASVTAESAGNNIIFTAAQNIVLGTVDARVAGDEGGTLTSQSSWGNVALTATTGTITNANPAPTSTTNIYADNLRLESSLGIGVLGASVNPIITEVITVAGVTDSAVSGDINLLEQTAITVGTVGVFSVNLVAANGSTSLSSTTSLSGLATATGSTGSIVLVTNSGPITVNHTVSAGGSGNLLIQSGGATSDLDSTALIEDATGNITLIGGDNVNFTLAGDVAVLGTGGVAGGTIGVIAQAGLISQAPTDYAQTDAGNIIFTAATNIVLGIVDARLDADRTGSVLTNQATWGNVALTATAGTIHNAQPRVGTTTNVYADALQLQALSGIGILGLGANNPIITEIATVAAVTTSASSGDIDLLEDTSESVGSIAVFSVNQVAANGSISATSTTALAGVTTTAGSTGAIVLVSTNGTITMANPVTAGASGDILIQAQGSGSNLLVQANVTTVTGDLTLIAAGGVSLTTGNVTVTGVGGTIGVVAQAAAITQSAAELVQTDGSNIIFTAATNIVVGIVDARVTSDQGGTLGSQSSWGNIALTATGGAITNAQSVAATANIFARNLRLESSTGIGVLGASANPIITEVSTIAAKTDSAVSGDINLQELTAITVGSVAVFSVHQVAIDNTTSLSSTTALSGLTTASGSTGSIVLVAGASGVSSLLTISNAVTAGGSGNILLYVGGTGSNLSATAAITSGSGNISVVANTNVSLTGSANVIVSSGAGTIVVDAQNGSVTQAATLAAQTNGANIGIAAATTIILGIADARLDSDRTGNTLTNQATWGNVAVLAMGGNITNAQTRVASVTNVYADNAIFEATTGIGTLGLGNNNPIVTELATVAAETTTSGGIDLLEQTAITVGPVGSFSVNLVGNTNAITTSQTTVSTLSNLTTANNGAIVLITNNGSITLNPTVSPATDVINAGGSGNVLIEAQGAASNLTLNAAVVSGTGNVTLSAGQNVLMGAAVTEVEAGNLVVSAGGSITMAATNQFGSASAVKLSAGSNLTLGQVSSTAANVWITATGAVTNAGNGTYAENVVAANAVIDGGVAVGASSTPIQTAVTTLTATGGTGGIYLDQTGATTIGPVSFSVLSVNPDRTTSSSTVTQNGVTTGAGGGAIALVVTGGGLTVNGNLSSPAGVSISSAGAVQENFAVTDAGTFAITASTSITMATLASITATGLSAVSSGNIQVSTINTGTGPISITGGGTLVNVLGSGGGTNLTGGTATITTAGAQGSTADTLNTALATLSATVTGTGAIVVFQTGALTLTNATTGNGLIQLVGTGTLTAVNVSGGGGAGVNLSTTTGDLIADSVTSASGAVTLTAAGNLTAQSVTAASGTIALTASGGNLLLGSVTAGSPVTASATAQIEQQTPGSTANLTAPQLTLTAGTGIGAPSAIVVAVPLLSAASTSGNIQIRNLLTTAVTVSNLSTGTGNITYSQAGGTENVTNATTTNGNIDLSLDTGALNVQNVAAGGTGDVTLNVTGAGQIQYTTATAGGGVLNISTSQTVTLTQNIVTNDTAVNLVGNILLSMNTSVTTNGGAVNFVNTVTGPYTLTVNSGAGAVNFTQAVGAGTGNALTSLTVNTSSTLSFGQSVTSAGDINLTSAGLTLAGGANSVSTTGGGRFIVQAAGTGNTISVGAVTGGTYTTALTTTDLAALAPGFSQVIVGSPTNTARVDVGTAAFTSPTLIQSAVAVQVLAGQTLAISGANTLALTGGTGDSGQVVMLAGSKIAAGSGTITLTADELNLASSAGSITGTGVLVLQPLTLSRPIVVGQAGISGQFALTLAELAVPATTLNVKIGDAQGTGPINVYAVNFDTPVTFQAGAASGSLTFNANVSTTLANDGISANIGGTITISGNLVVAVSGSINLVAAASGNGVGNIVIAPTANELLHTVSGNISLTGQNMTFGTFSLWTDIVSSGSVNITVGAVGGTLQINDIYSEIKANTNIVIASGSATPSATGQIELEGQVQAVGTVTVTSNSSINLDNSSLVALGNVVLQSTGNILLSAGIINSQQGTVAITANSAQTGAGALSVAGISPVLINSNGNVSLTGESVALGNGVAFARVIAPNLNIFADYYPADQGSITIANANTQLEVTNNIQIGAPTFSAGTPYNVSFTGGTITNGGTFSLYALDNVTSANTNFNSTGVFSMSADVNLTINSGSILTGGAALTLLADASTGLNGALTLAANTASTEPTIYDPNATVTLSGYTVSNNAAIIDLHLVITTGH